MYCLSIKSIYKKEMGTHISACKFYVWQLQGKEKQKRKKNLREVIRDLFVSEKKIMYEPLIQYEIV